MSLVSQLEHLFDCVICMKPFHSSQQMFIFLPWKSALPTCEGFYSPLCCLHVNHWFSSFLRRKASQLLIIMTLYIFKWNRTGSSGRFLGVSWLLSKRQRINDHVRLSKFRPFEANINRPLWLTSEKDDKGKKSLIFSHCRSCSNVF